MQPAWNKMQRWRVGLLVLGSVGLLLVLLVFVVGVSLGGRANTYYILIDQSVKGLVVGSAVNFQGVPVGAVADIRFQNGKTRVEVKCDPTRATVQASTHARLDRAWVTGQVTVELEGYRAGEPPLEDGATIPAVRSPLAEITETLPDVAQDLGALVRQARQLVANLEEMTGPDNRRRVERMLDGIGSACATLPEEIEATLVETRAAAAALRGVATDGDLHGTLAEARLAVQRLAQLERRADELFGELSGAIASARGPLLGMLGAARDAMTQVRTLARQLTATPSALFFGEPADELAVPGATRGSGR